MPIDVLQALISLLGAAFGTFGGIVAAQKLSTYRIERLEAEVREHNNYARRLPVVEKEVEVLNHRISDLECYHKGG